MDRILGLDYGTKTVGVAVTDGLGLTAQGLEIIRREKPKKLRKTIARIRELIDEYDVKAIVLGKPLNMNGSSGFRVEDTLEFKALLEEKTRLPVYLEDERLTTVDAYEIMEEVGVKKKDQKAYVDEIAAILILESYMHREEGK
ncbi:MAG: Holliday junction resolvase RuvX [Lachnospiraceae bacterium]|nr:Holliday junction resolvase RuvX [Lachnospiraceae bacterium]MDD6449731.1 Holliday junction resolvase RuvX [Lachnospiraceae bacterium]MDD6451050.1 Holliday junction resolvase RuvX [Lachnospiraceae bacterium]MDD6578209.1 Holliday junction resolvase RuvX [Lachnospiraceae bacterium]